MTLLVAGPRPHRRLAAALSLGLLAASPARAQPGGADPAFEDDAPGLPGARRAPVAAPPAPAPVAAPPAPAPVAAPPAPAPVAAPAPAPVAAPVAAPAPAPTAPPTAAPPPAPVPVASALGRFIPDLSGVLDVAAGWYSEEAATTKSGSDPAAGGFNLQRVELGLEMNPHTALRAALYLVVPNLRGLDVDEGYLEARWAQMGVHLKAGVYRAAFGRDNTQHLHELSFARRPVVSASFLGLDSLRAPGLELGWKLPWVRFPLWIRFGALSVAPAPADQVLQSFGGGERYDFAYVLSARAAIPFGVRSSVHAGLSWARGKTSQTTNRATSLISVDKPAGAVSFTAYDNFYDYLYGADLYLHWRPASNPDRTSISWQTELVVRDVPNFVFAGLPHRQVEGGLYTQLVVQAARIAYFGARFEMLGTPRGDSVRPEYAGALSLTVAPWSFMKFRLHGELRGTERAAAIGRTDLNGAFFLQLEAALGAHGMHDHGGGR